MKIRRSSIALLLAFVCLFAVLAVLAMLAFIGNGTPLPTHSASVTQSAAALRNSISPALLLTLTGEVAFDHFGRSVTFAGDVNGDGFADVLSGADAHADARGRAYLYWGSSTGLSAIPALTLTGEAAGDFFGAIVTSVGDVNGDGFVDVGVGAWGRAYFYLGSPTGLKATPTLTLTGESPTDGFGFALAAAGDVNGDGLADVIVGASRYNRNQGRAYLYLGSPTGLKATPTLTLTGEVTGDTFGESVASAGDVNGDGFADVIIGALYYNNLQGRAYLYLGSSTGLNATPALTLTGDAPADGLGSSAVSAGDVNGDGLADVIVGAAGSNNGQGRASLYLGSPIGLSANPTLTLTGEGTSDNFGFSVASAGDVNGDSFADVLIGARCDHGSRGCTYLYLGGLTGLRARPVLTLTEEAANNYFGHSLASAGDVNGDGFAEMLVGMPNYGTEQGRVYVYGLAW